MMRKKEEAKKIAIIVCVGIQLIAIVFGIIFMVECN